MPLPLDLTGQIFGYLTVLHRGQNHGTYTTWVVRCTCGVIKEVETRNLSGAFSKSCGCRRAELISDSSEHLTKDPAYKSWQMMLQRCNNPNYNHYHYYGGRGITVAPELQNFKDFRNVMGDRPPGATIDRIDPNGNYTPDNVRWASREEQVRNRRNVHQFNHDGRTFNIAELSREFGKSTKFFRDHLLTNGESLADVLNNLKK